MGLGRWRRRLAGLALSLASACAWAEPALDASVSLRADGWSSDRRLNDAGTLGAAAAWGRARLDLGQGAAFIGNGWVRGSTRADGAPHGRIRELYWRTDVGPVALRAGRQMVAWGKADGLNPTDMLSPRDFTLLVPESGDQRHGNEAISASMSLGAGDLTLLGFARAASHTVPMAEVPGVKVTVESPPHKPQWALKWESRRQGADWSVSYFDGYDPTPDLNLAGVSGAQLDVIVRNQRARVFGADMSLAKDAIVWRAEGAWLLTDSSGAEDFRHKKPQLWLVAGAEWQLPENTTLGVQASVLHVFDFASADTLSNPFEREVAERQATAANQTARDQLGVVWRLAKRWRNDNVHAELSGIALGPAGGIVRASLDYALTDHWNVQVGGDHIYGPDHGYLGQFRRNSLAYIQLRYGFSVDRKLGR